MMCVAPCPHGDGCMLRVSQYFQCPFKYLKFLNPSLVFVLHISHCPFVFVLQVRMKRADADRI